MTLVNASSYARQIRADGTATDEAKNYGLVGATGTNVVTATVNRSQSYQWYAGLGVLVQTEVVGPANLRLAKDGTELTTLDGSGGASQAVAYACDQTMLKFTYADGSVEQFTRS